MKKNIKGEIMKRILGLILLSTLSYGLHLLQPVGDHYYDKKTEGVLVPLQNCNYAVGFQFFSGPQSIAGLKKKKVEEIPSNMESIFMEKIGKNYSLRNYKVENFYIYFLEQIPPRGGFMRIVYLFEDIDGKLHRRKEDIFNANYHQKFPSPSVIPRQCWDRGPGYLIDKGRDSFRKLRSRTKPKIKKGVRKIRMRIRDFKKEHNF